MRAFLISFLLFCMASAASAQTLAVVHLDTVRGPIAVAASSEGWCYVDPDDDGVAPWLGPIPTRLLDRFAPDQYNSTAGVSGCYLVFVNPPGGPPAIVIVPFSYTATAPTLSQAVAAVASQLQTALGNGAIHVPCPPTSAG